MTRNLLASLAILLPVLAHAEPQDRVLNYRAGDTRMNAAIAKAQATLPAFETVLQSGRGTGFTVKVRVPYGPSTAAEHLWIVDIRSDGRGGYAGIVGNQVDHVPNLHKGSSLHAAKVDISNWMYTDARGVHGGYTVRVMLQDMSPAERAEYGLHFAD